MDPTTELKKAESVLADLEQLITSQSTPYMVHVERLAGLKYLHKRLIEFKRLEEERSKQELVGSEAPEVD